MPSLRDDKDDWTGHEELWNWKPSRYALGSARPNACVIHSTTIRCGSRSGTVFVIHFRKLAILDVHDSVTGRIGSPQHTWMLLRHFSMA